MSTYFLKICCALLLLLLLLHAAGSIHMHGDVKCMEKERQVLLNFKQSLFDGSGMLSTWRDDHNNRDCCIWRGVECSNETGHVHMLSLGGSDIQYLLGDINVIVMSLIELLNLEFLDLSYNYFGGTQIPKHIGSFKNLRYLNLSSTNIGGRIPYQLGDLSQLEYLDLSSNQLVGAIPYQLGKLTQLRYLNLNDNDEIDGEIPYQLGNLSQLQYLDLGGISFGGIPFEAGNLPMLRTLRLNSDLKINDAKWLSSLTSLTNLELVSVFSQGLLKSIGKVLSNLKELRLSYCVLSDNDILALFGPYSKFSTSLTILDLSYNLLTSSAFYSLSNFSFNYLEELYLSENTIMSFPPYLNLPSLRILDLSFNNLTSPIFQGNYNFISKLEELHLENWTLSDSDFRAPSPPIINSSSSLTILDLTSNMLTSSTIFHWLFNFTTNLHSLELDYNLLEGPIPNGFDNEMNSLEKLSLRFNKLKGEIPASLGNICALRELLLSGNNLSGEMSSFIQNLSLCNKHMLQTMDLSYNMITGLLPNLSVLPSLWHLDLSNNHLIGEIPKSLGSMNELRSLYLNGNYFDGDITELYVSNLSKLMWLDLSDNSLSLNLDTKWVPPFQLFVLGLASCKLGPSFPTWLRTQRYLIFIDISNAGIHDSVPMWFWNKLHSISGMNISYNNLVGTIPNLPLKLTNDEYGKVYVLNSNQFEGSVPEFLLQASALDLSKNKISDFNSFLCGKSTTTNMQALDLSDNQLKGHLPDCWGYLNSLRFLDLSNNKLTGKIPPSMTTLYNLEALVLRNNSFIGELPSTLKNCSKLVILDVGENLLTDSIPTWIGESLLELKILSLRVNHFFGMLPSHLCYLRHIHLLDLSSNNLSRSIPTCLNNFTAMMEKSMDLNGIVRKRRLSIQEGIFNIYESNLLLTWKGQEFLFKNPELLLKSIDLSKNDLSGKIPTELGQLLGLVSLNLSSNNFSGEIPSDIGNLNSLESLDLSRNHLSGKIPETLTLINFLEVLDLSHNSLSGKIPLGTQLQSFDPSSFEGNMDLCGKPLEKICPEDETPVKPQGLANDVENDNSVFYEALYMSMGIGFFTGFWCLIGPLLIWQPWRNAYVRFLNKLTD